MYIRLDTIPRRDGQTTDKQTDGQTVMVDQVRAVSKLTRDKNELILKSNPGK